MINFEFFEGIERLWGLTWDGEGEDHSCEGANELDPGDDVFVEPSACCCGEDHHEGEQQVEGLLWLLDSHELVEVLL